MDKLNIAIRLAEKTDLPFILDSWTQCMKHMYPNQYALDFSKNYQNDHLKPLIEKSGSVIAHLEDEANEIISFLVFGSFKDNLIVHYAYTKVDARKQGIINQLIEFASVGATKQSIIFTHAAKNENTMMALMKKYIYDPSILRIMK